MKILVTGAAGGLGYCLCHEAVSRGWKVIGVDRRPGGKELQTLMEQGKVEFYLCDMGDPDSVLQLTKEVLKKETSLDGMVNNVGVVLGRESFLEELDMDDLRRSMEINVYGPMVLTQKLLPLLRKSESAGIVNISSSAAAYKGAREIDFPYAMSKGALTMFTEKLRVYVKKDGIRVAAVHPGWMRTEMGGDSAAVEPAEVAVHVLDILCGKQIITAEPAFVNRFGEPIRDRNDI